MNLKVMGRDEAFSYLYEDNELKGAVQTHVDDFKLARNTNFIEKIIEGVSQKLTISKIERGKFRFTGLDFFKQENNIGLYTDGEHL